MNPILWLLAYLLGVAIADGLWHGFAWLLSKLRRKPRGNPITYDQANQILRAYFVDASGQPISESKHPFLKTIESVTDKKS